MRIKIEIFKKKEVNEDITQNIITNEFKHEFSALVCKYYPNWEKISYKKIMDNKYDEDGNPLEDPLIKMSKTYAVEEYIKTAEEDHPNFFEINTYEDILKDFAEFLVNNKIELRDW